ncbi:MAG: antibiotic biosynthesis monooxygenase [Actinomycetota bacterium]
MATRVPRSDLTFATHRGCAGYAVGAPGNNRDARRDLESPGLFWSPTRWDSREALEAWRTGSRYATCLEAVGEDVMEHRTHIMDVVEGFPPQRASQ